MKVILALSLAPGHGEPYNIVGACTGPIKHIVGKLCSRTGQQPLVDVPWLLSDHSMLHFMRHVAPARI